MSTHTKSIFGICTDTNATPEAYQNSTGSQLRVATFTSSGTVAEIEPRDLASTKVDLSVGVESPYDPVPPRPDEVAEIGLGKVNTTRPETIQVMPRLFHQDIMSEVALREWNERDCPSKDGEPSNWRSALLAGQRWRAKWPGELHEHTGMIHHFDLYFNAGPESYTIDKFYGLPDAKGNVDSPAIADERGEFSMAYTERQMDALLGKIVPGLGKGNTLPIIPLKIEVIKEDSNLPVTYTAELSASNPKNPTVHKSWSTPSGGHQYGARGAEHTDYFHHIVYPGQKIQSKDHRDLLYLIDYWRYNSPWFARLINVDSAQLYKQLEEARDPGQRDYVEFLAPPLNLVVPDNLLQFFAIEEWPRINAISAAQGKVTGQIPQTEDGRYRFRVSYHALKYVIDDHLKFISAENLAMMLNDVRLTLRPLQSQITYDSGRQISQGALDIQRLAPMIRMAGTPGDMNKTALHTRYGACVRLSFTLRNSRRFAASATASIPETRPILHAYTAPTAAAGPSVAYPALRSSQD